MNIPALLRLPPLPLLAGISLTIGLLIPSVFELGQQPASRQRHFNLEVAAIIVLAATALVSLAVLLLRQRHTEPARETGPAGKWQFGLLHLFVAITVLAVTLAVVPLLEWRVASAVVAALVIAIAAWAYRRSVSSGGRIVALLACMYLPFAWMIADSVPFGRTSGLVEVIPIAPGILLAELTRASGSLDRSVVESIAAVAVIFQLLLGAWLAAQSTRASLAYALLTLAASSVGSLVVHALCRA